MIIKAKGNLIGTVIQDFEIKPRDITDKNVIVEDTVYTFGCLFLLLYLLQFQVLLQSNGVAARNDFKIGRAHV